jgi:hypothetical protein
MILQYLQRTPTPKLSDPGTKCKRCTFPIVLRLKHWCNKDFPRYTEVQTCTYNYLHCQVAISICVRVSNFTTGSHLSVSVLKPSARCKTRTMSGSRRFFIAKSQLLNKRGWINEHSASLRMLSATLSTTVSKSKPGRSFFQREMGKT